MDVLLGITSGVSVTVVNTSRVLVMLTVVVVFADVEDGKDTDRGGSSIQTVWNTVTVLSLDPADEMAGPFVAAELEPFVTVELDVGAIVDEAPIDILLNAKVLVMLVAFALEVEMLPGGGPSSAVTVAVTPAFVLAIEMLLGAETADVCDPELQMMLQMASPSRPASSRVLVLL